jgi:hypothetical protein
MELTISYLWSEREEYTDALRPYLVNFVGIQLLQNPEQCMKQLAADIDRDLSLPFKLNTYAAFWSERVIKNWLSVIKPSPCLRSFKAKAVLRIIDLNVYDSKYLNCEFLFNMVKEKPRCLKESTIEVFLPVLRESV